MKERKVKESEKYIAIELFKIRKKYIETIDNLERAGVTLPESLVGDLDKLLDLALDILGVPEDNTPEHFDEDTGTFTDGYYCRDHFWDVCAGLTPEDFINYVDNDMKEWNHHLKVNKFLEKRSIDNISVDEMELTVRTDNCLQSKGIRTIGQLVKKKASELYKIRNFGRKSHTEIEEKLQELGLTLEQ